jgi:hypothetical protein
VVTSTVLKVAIREIRKALGEDTPTPRYIETVGRLGYRCIAPLTTPALLVSSSEFQVPSSLLPTLVPRHAASILVGRDAELRQLHDWLEKALRGKRQVGFVTGEPGIGKTTLVEVFLGQVHADGHIRIGRGQCLEQRGQGEAYLPVLEAFGRLCQEPEGEQIVAVLRQHAPTWLLQIQAGLPEAEFKA